MRWPVDRPVVTPHGGYLFHRTTRPFCDGRPPCDHHGIDLAGAAGDPVYAPESGVLIYSFVGNAIKPFSRFGPAGVVLLGVESGKYNLLMHLAAPTIFTAQQRNGHAIRQRGTIAVLEGQQLGVIGDRNHVHWEMRTDPDDRETHVDPVAELQLYGDATLDRRPPAEPRRTPAPRSGGGGWFLAMLILLAAAASKGRGARWD